MTTRYAVDLRSDTATKPTSGMREAIARADVGDEQRGEDPSVNRLCERVAERLGKARAIYLPSGIMSNLVAILVHCRPGDEIITAGNAHIIGSEGAGASALAGAMISPIETADGRFTADQLKARMRPTRPRAPRTRLVSVEQTSNAGGGTVWPETTLRDIADVAANAGVKVHMDGARLFNAAIASNHPPEAFARHCDTVWIDLSKGLGCPVGSVLAGSDDFIEEAWVWKHRLGGAMRQAGMMAAAGLYALDHHIDRLADDHENAQRLAAGLADIDRLTIVGNRVETNIVFIDLSATGQSAHTIAERLAAHGVLVGPSSSTMIRAVTHLDVSADQIDAAIHAFGTVLRTRPS